MTTIIYLHGLLSSSKSTKGNFLKTALGQNCTVITPDLYPERELFEKMTVSSLLTNVDEWVRDAGDPLILTGSSFGGLIATRYIQTRKKYSGKVRGLVLIAPALNFNIVLENRHIPSNEWINWQQRGFTHVDHPAWIGKTKWSWEFIEDLQEYHYPMNEPLNIPVLLIHGEKDNVIPVSNSRSFVGIQDEQGSHWDTHYLEKADHQMLGHLPKVAALIMVWLVKKGLFNR
ncbi:MAG: YqiA/YcfP family alpha/beta fold hydrolase [Candidatus Hodarchaeales archaeon]